MAASASVPINLQAATADLARRLSCLEYFLEAANELLTCERLPSREISRHYRKVDYFDILLCIAECLLSHPFFFFR